MLYLFIQTWGWILAAFILGILIGWWLCCCCRCANQTQSTATSPKPEKNVTAAPASVDMSNVDDDAKPMGFTAAPTEVDDLKRIKGVGPVIERTLNDLGIYQFKQIAELTRENIDWVESYLSFPGRIDREEWVSQAKILSTGEETDFSKKS